MGGMMSVKSKIKNKIRSNFNRLRKDASWQLGIDQSYIKNAKGSRIIVYHGICMNNHLRFDTLFLALKTFEKQLKFYKRYFNIISLDDFYQRRFSNTKFNICLTFDD